MVNKVRQTEIHTAEPLVLELSAFEFEINDVKLQKHKPPCTDQIPTEFIKAGGRNTDIHKNDIHKLIDFICYKEELTEEWKVSIIVPIYMKGDKVDCGNYSDIVLPTMYKTLSTILLSRLTPYTKEIIRDH